MLYVADYQNKMVHLLAEIARWYAPRIGRPQHDPGFIMQRWR